MDAGIERQVISMKEFLSLYWRQKSRWLLAGLLICGMFMGSFALYHLPVETAAYPTLLAALLLIIFLARDIQKAWRKYKYLQELCRLPGELMEQFPEIRCPEDAAYQQLLRKLRQEQGEIRNTMTRQYEDMMEYYTLWVHQIKVPIASMHLQLQNEDSDLARRCSEELQRIEQYVAMVLAYLRLDSRSSDYVLRENDLDTILRGAVRKFAGQFIQRHLLLTYNPVNTLVLTDEKWLAFVVEQLLSNAVKYTQQGGVEIYLEAPKTLCIRDAGVGISAEDLPRIVEKGYTGSNGRADLRSSGIGLYLCRRICNNLGHGLSVESSPGEGTTVRLDLAQAEFTPE